eukprot:c21972_g1_i1.p1 GENE.c21972_g1_i1~~c21972_g1_i1.p1  ORF type:complete len:287 (+),score=83.84 c21972_g1_i1:22-882(+)
MTSVETLTPQQPATVGDDFRNYVDSKRQDGVKHHYQMMRQHQTLEYVLKMKEKYSQFSNGEMTILEAMDALGDFVDASDPDTAEPNVFHLYQTAEGLRAAGEPDWMQLTGLVHDLGKLLSKFGSGNIEGQDGNGGEQWGLTGDTFIVGCKLPNGAVFPEFNSLNPDMQNPAYNTENGIYTPHCGLNNTHCAFGHDEYLYMVLKNHKSCSLPQSAFDIIRYHSLYPWHHAGEYKHLMNEDDVKMMEVVQRFQKHDLYTKHGEKPNVEELKSYYSALIDKYIPGKLKW